MHFTDENDNPLTPESSQAKDQRSGLIWQRDTYVRLNWKQARIYANQLRLGGSSKWRLPTRKELFTLIEDDRKNPCIDKDSFPSCPSEEYWTSTRCVNGTIATAFSIDFFYGNIRSDALLATNLVRCVRLESNIKPSPFQSS